jgi:prepilin-type N-terminal cleavage/methylation domain-containing protein
LAVHARPGNREAGLTIVEVLLVMVIVAILVAIAIPTFMGARKRSLDEQVQASLRRALVVENGLRRNEGRFSAGPAGPAVVARVFGGQDMVVLAAKSGSGRVFCTARVASGRARGTYYAQGKPCSAVTGTRDLKTSRGWSTRSEMAW